MMVASKDLHPSPFVNIDAIAAQKVDDLVRVHGDSTDPLFNRFVFWAAVCVAQPYRSPGRSSEVVNYCAVLRAMSRRSIKQDSRCRNCHHRNECTEGNICFESLISYRISAHAWDKKFSYAKLMPQHPTAGIFDFTKFIALLFAEYLDIARKNKFKMARKRESLWHNVKFAINAIICIILPIKAAARQ